MNHSEISKKKLALWLILMMLVVIIVTTVTTAVKKYEAEKPARELKHYSELVNERCDSNFSIINNTFGDDCFWGFQDVGYEIKCELDPDEKIDETYLLQNGWHCTKFPDELIQEGVLGKTSFTKEMYNANYQYQSYWKYIDIETERHGKRAFNGQEIYRSSHYLIVLCVPSWNVLYYIEESI